MFAEIISVGNELLSGTTLNTNAVFLARNLGLMGFDVHCQSVVGDVESDIVDIIKLAASRSHIIVMTGGLGPTKDDLTKESVAKAFELTLTESPVVVQQIRNYFAQRGREITQNNFKQALIIEGAEILKNPNGTAPGQFLQTATQAIAMLPGPPNEMEAMFRDELKPRLERMSHDFSRGASLHVFGIGEAALEERVGDLLYEENPSAALYAKPGEVFIDIIARGASPDEAKSRLDECIKMFQERIGECIYSVNGESMAETVCRLLRESGSHIAIAESCTGGLMAARLTEVEGASGVFEFGMAAYADWVKQSSLSVEKNIIRKFSSVSSAAVAEMAKGARDKGNADIGVGITGIAGPSSGDFFDKPVGLVYIAVADRKRVFVKSFNFSNMRSRASIRELAVMSAFDMVRRLLLGLEIEDAFRFGNNQLADIEREGTPRNKSILSTQQSLKSLIAVLTIAAMALLGYRAVRERLNTSIYNDLRSSVIETSANGTRAFIGLESLLQRNDDTVGWLSSSGVAIDSVVVSSAEEGYYQDHDFEGARNALGCLHLDGATNLRDDLDNFVIYGSSSDSELLFGPLKNYTNPDFLKKNAILNFYGRYDSGDYKIVSVYFANTNPEYGEVQTLYAETNFASSAEFTEFVIDFKLRSVIDTGVDVYSGDTFLTLVTELNDWDGARLVVVARRVRAGEKAEVSTALITRNIAAVYPPAWYTVTKTMPVYNEVVERDRWANWLLLNEKNSSSNATASSNKPPAVTANNPHAAVNNDGEVVLRVIMNGEDITDTPLNIVSRMVAFEVGTDASIDVTKAQAIACATWLRYTCNAEAAPEISGNNPTERVKGLVADVIDICLFYNGEVAYTPYFEIAASRTYSAAEIWDENFPYLVSVESRFDYMVNGYTRETDFSFEALRLRIESSYNIKLSDNYSNWIQIQERVTGGSIKTIVIDGQITVSGNDFADRCLNLRSANFTIRTGSSSIVFITTGFGTGVGMSKSGASQYVMQLYWNYEQVLMHYYPGLTFGEMVW